jgi:hypothetical protein
MTLHCFGIHFSFKRYSSRPGTRYVALIVVQVIRTRSTCLQTLLLSVAVETLGQLFLSKENQKMSVNSMFFSCLSDKLLLLLLFSLCSFPDGRGAISSSQKSRP